MGRAGPGPLVTTFVFRVRNVPAALYKALGGFATNGVNMTKLESYMIDGNFFATQFYADVDGHPDDKNLTLRAGGTEILLPRIQDRRRLSRPSLPRHVHGNAGVRVVTGKRAPGHAADACSTAATLESRAPRRAPRWWSTRHRRAAPS